MNVGLFNANPMVKSMDAVTVPASIAVVAAYRCGFTGVVGSSDFKPCSAGYYCPAGNSSSNMSSTPIFPVQCPAGSYCRDAACSPTPCSGYECPAGQYLSGCSETSAGACTNCSTCPPGLLLSGCNGTSAGACVAGPATDASASQYSVGASGLTLIQASYNLTASAWVIDVAYSKSSPDAVVALYLPRTQAGPDGYYTALFNSTFFPAGFPCSAADPSTRAATTCCLPDFIGRYHVAAAFSVANSSGAACASPYATPPPLIATDSVAGSFGSDMPSSRAEALPPASGQPAWVSAVRITVGRADLRARASRSAGQGGASNSEALDSFVGLAQLMPVPGLRVLDSSASQVALSLVQSDYFTVTAAGTDAQTFLSYISLRVNEVLDAADPAQRSQYAAVSFALNDNFQPNADTGLIPAASIRVGAGASRASANWTSPCDRAVSPQFAARLSQPCGPAVAVCSAGAAVSLADRCGARPRCARSESRSSTTVTVTSRGGQASARGGPRRGFVPRALMPNRRHAGS